MVKLYKKTFLLAALVLCGSFAMNAQNLILNGGFETGILAPWTAGNGNTVNIVADAQAGDWAANGNIEQLVALTAGETYTWTAQVKCVGACDENMWVGIRDIVGEKLVTNFRFSDQPEYFGTEIEFTAETTGDYRFWAWGQGESDYTTDSHVLLLEGTTTSVSDLDRSEMNVYADASGINVTFDSDVADAEVQVYDLTGKLMAAQKMNNSSTIVSTDQFTASGMYVVAVKADGRVQSQQVYVTAN